MERICKTCKESKDISNFGHKKGNRDNLRPECYACRRKYYRENQVKISMRYREWWKHHPQAIKQAIGRRFREKHKQRLNALQRINYNGHKDRNRKLKKLYGITHDDYNRILKKQGRGCAICHNKKNLINGQMQHFYVDHSHKTGKFRGLLCRKCNLGLGNFQESIAILEQAIGYLRVRDQQQSLTILNF